MTGPVAEGGPVVTRGGTFMARVHQCKYSTPTHIRPNGPHAVWQPGSPTGPQSSSVTRVRPAGPGGELSGPGRSSSGPRPVATVRPGSTGPRCGNTWYCATAGPAAANNPATAARNPVLMATPGRCPSETRTEEIGQLLPYER